MKTFHLILIPCLILVLCGSFYGIVDPCAACHKDMTTVLPKGHAEVKGGLAQCISCHNTGQSGGTEKNAFSTVIHQRHAAQLKLKCTTCHEFVQGKSFGLVGTSVNWGPASKEDIELMKQKMTSWATSSFTDNLHAKAQVDCAGCHGKQLPVADTTVENPRCLACHGPVEKLAEKSANKEFPKRNPHASHYGSDIACTSCHHAHDASEVMCAGCHKLWKLNIPGTAKE